MTKSFKAILLAGDIKTKELEQMKAMQQTGNTTKLTYQGDRVSEGVYEVAMAVRTKCKWVKLMECDKILQGKMFLQKITRATNKSYERPAFLHRIKE